MMALPINGWLNLNKPLGITSAKAVAIVKKYLRPIKIGHAGTLDPLASGVLPLALGEATKSVQFCMDSNKEYEFTVKWGFETTTCDAEGEVIKTSTIRPTKEEILAVLPDFTGTISQSPPQYSAIKINGKRAYEIARDGEVIEMQSRVVHVNSLELIEEGEGLRAMGKGEEQNNSTPFSLFPSPIALSSFRVSCGKGTYVRSLARDIALKLGTFGYVTSLTRTKVGNFTIESAILLEDIEKAVYKDAHSGFLLPVDAVLDDIQVLQFTPEEAARLRFGQKMSIETLTCKASNQQVISGGVFIAKCNDKLVAMCEFEGVIIKPIRVFNL